jgi:hypothetical protein
MSKFEIRYQSLDNVGTWIETVYRADDRRDFREMLDKLILRVSIGSARGIQCEDGTTVSQQWEVITHDVWGNAEDGYEVNNSFRQGTAEIDAPVTRYNVGTPHEFSQAYPTEQQIREAFGDTSGVEIEIDGDDRYISVNIAEDGYPYGELRLIEK